VAREADRAKEAAERLGASWAATDVDEVLDHSET
jgi:predicted dehydrogenase